ncbi:MAG: hydroxysqualene dehydroxylase HpnE [Candidatus Bathyarchaeia archaeon]
MSTNGHNRVVIVGGGFAGLAAGVALAEAGYQVELLERRAALGGRAYSFIDQASGEVIDNGQHLFMGCYHETFKFLRKLGTDHLVRLQSRPRVDFLDSEGRHSSLDCPNLPPPLHLLAGLMRMRGISLGEKLSAIRVSTALQARGARLKARLGRLTVDEWLNQCGQSQQIKDRFWDMLSIATLNLSPERAAAILLARVLQQGFAGTRTDSCMVTASVGLSELYTEQARAFIEARGGLVRLRTPVKRLLIEGGRCMGVETATGEIVTASYCISAVPYFALARLLPEELFANPYFAACRNFESSPIVSINLWFDRPVTEFGFVGLVKGRIHWLFNKDVIFRRSGKDDHLISCVISAADSYRSATREELVALAMEDLARFLPDIHQARLLRSLVVKEQHATFCATVEAEEQRPDYRTPIENLLLAGDWTNTGLPATIEGAVLSGHKCAEMICG